MGSPAIFAGKRSKLLSSKGLLYSNGSINDYNGDINYILNGHAEVNTAGWATYADAAQSTPVDGTGGSPSVTWTQTTTSPLDDLGSFVFTKDAVNRQGQGVSYAFTIDSASQAKVMTITCDYIVGSGTFVAGSSSVDSDLEVFIYDVTNSVLIQPSTYKLYSNSSTIPSQFIANFQTSYNSTSYRLIFHCATTSASAYTVKFDNVKVSPQQYTYGTPITYLGNLGTITVTAVTSNPTKGTVGTDRITGSRIGNRVLLDYQYQQTAAGSSAAGSGDYLFALPAGMSFDSSIITPYSGTIHTTNTGLALAYVGTATMTQGTRTSIGTCYAYSATTFRVWFTAATADGSTLVNYVISSSQSGFTEAATIGYAFNINAAIQGYSSAVQMSDSTTQQVVAASYWCSTNFAASTTVPINFDSKDFDTTGSVTTSATAWKYTAPVAGVYQVSMFTNVVGTTTANYVIYKNGSAYKSLFYSISAAPSGGCQELQLNAGDYIDIRPSTAATVVGGSLTAAGTAIITIQRISGPASIAATDTVAASYYLSANQSLTANTTIINLDTKIFDKTNMVTTGASWKATAPVAGTYLVTLSASYTSGAAGSIYLRVNGTSQKFMPSVDTSGGTFNGTTLISLLAGDYIDFMSNTTLVITGTSAPYRTHFSMVKVGF